VKNANFDLVKFDLVTRTHFFEENLKHQQCFILIALPKKLKTLYFSNVGFLFPKNTITKRKEQENKTDLGKFLNSTMTKVLFRCLQAGKKMILKLLLN
jgi:hypothetical protein